MALTTTERHTLFESLTPVIGSEEAALLLDQFPAKEGDELVTTTHLDLAMTKVDARFAALEARTDARFAALEASLDTRFAAMQTNLAHAENRLYVAMVGLVTVGVGIVIAVGR